MTGIWQGQFTLYQVKAAQRNEPQREERVVVEAMVPQVLVLWEVFDPFPESFKIVKSLEFSVFPPSLLERSSSLVHGGGPQSAGAVRWPKKKE